jgi:GT2 family glycosyltransferase
LKEETEATGEQPPRVSIVVLSYNTRQVTLRCLEVLGAAEPPPDMQFIVVDNASSDGSVAAVRERFPEVELVASDRNLLFAGGMNLGASHARGEYVLLLNADTEVTEEQVRELAGYLDAHPEVGAAGPAQADSAGQPERARTHDLSPANLVLSMLGSHVSAGSRLKDSNTGAVAYLSGSAIIIRRELGERIGYYDEGFPFYWEDTDLSQRIRDMDYEVHLVTAVKILHHHAASSHQIDRAQRRRWAAQGLVRFANKHCTRTEAVVIFAIRLTWCLAAGLLALLLTVLTLGQVRVVRDHMCATFAVAEVLYRNGLLRHPTANDRRCDTEEADVTQQAPPQGRLLWPALRPTRQRRR